MCCPESWLQETPHGKRLGTRGVVMSMISHIKIIKSSYIWGKMGEEGLNKFSVPWTQKPLKFLVKITWKSVEARHKLRFGQLFCSRKKWRKFIPGWLNRPMGTAIFSALLGFIPGAKWCFTAGGLSNLAARTERIWLFLLRQKGHFSVFFFFFSTVKEQTISISWKNFYEDFF